MAFARPFLGRGVSSRAVEEHHPCRFILHPEGSREGGDRAPPLLFWGEEVDSTFALVQLVEDEAPHLLLIEKRRV